MLRIYEQYFMAVAECGSFSGAAKRLFISQPAVSKQITLYEAELGFSLFDRSTRSVRLTYQGRLLYNALKNIVREWNEALEAAKKVDIKSDGRLRVGLLYGWSISRLPTNAFKNFKSQYPHVELILEKNTYIALSQCLLDGSLDIIMTIQDEISQYGQFCSCPAYREPLILLVRSDYPISSPDNIRAELPDIPLYAMGPHESYCTVDKINNIFPNSLKLFQRPNFESILLALDQGLGGTLTALSSGACDNPAYKYYETGQFIEVVCAWRKDDDNPLIRQFLAEF